MMSFGGWDVRNILTGPSLALLGLYILVFLGVVGLHFGFRGNVIV